MIERKGGWNPTLAGLLAGLGIGYPLSATIGFAVDEFQRGSTMGLLDVAMSFVAVPFLALPIYPLSLPAIVACALVGNWCVALADRFGWWVFVVAGACAGALAAQWAQATGFGGMTLPALVSGAATASFLRGLGLSLGGGRTSPDPASSEPDRRR